MVQHPIDRTDTRHFHDDLHDLEMRMLEMGADVQDLVGLSIRGLVEDDSHHFRGVVAGDDLIDTHYLQIERAIVNFFALQTPVASDLRLLTVLLHINLHLERIADMAVNMAKLGALAHGLPRDDSVLTHLKEMGEIALRMIGAAMEALARKDLDLCLQLPKMDDPIDRLNRGMLQQVLALAHDKRLLEWGIRMHVVSRQLERIGDHAVDVAEQIAYLVTGEFREFTDASHPQGAD